MDNLVIPESKITIEGKEYVLDASTKTLKDIQHAVGVEIVAFLNEHAREAGFDTIARLFDIGIRNAEGQKSPGIEAIEKHIVDEMGVRMAALTAVAWLFVAISPKRERPKKSEEMANLLQTMARK